MSGPREGGCACGAVRYRLDVRAALHALLPLPELPAADRQRVRHQPADRGRPRRAARRRAAAGRRAARRRQRAADLPVPDLPGGGLQRVRTTRACCSSAAARSTTRRASRPTPTSSPGRSSVGRAAGVGAGVRRLLRLEDAVAGREPRAAARGQARGRLRDRRPLPPPRAGGGSRPTSLHLPEEDADVAVRDRADERALHPFRCSASPTRTPSITTSKDEPT